MLTAVLLCHRYVPCWCGGCGGQWDLWFSSPGAGPGEDLTFQAVTSGPWKCHLCHKQFYEGFGFELLSGATVWLEKGSLPLFLAKSHNSRFSKGSKAEMGSWSFQIPWDTHFAQLQLTHPTRLSSQKCVKSLKGGPWTACKVVMKRAKISRMKQCLARFPVFPLYFILFL